MKRFYIIIVFLLINTFCYCQCNKGYINGVAIPCTAADSLAYISQQSIGKTHDSLQSISLQQKASQIATLKSFAYKGLNEFTAGGTLTAAQIQEAIQLYLYNQGAFNPATNKIDSTLNYIK
jgi:hypothetical protein